jgi:TatD DNase family protein
MEFVDTHCHLHFEKFGADRQTVYQNAQAAGVKRMICVGTSIDDSQAAIGFVQDKPGLWAAAGVHPHDAEAVVNLQGQALRELLKRPKVVAVGEIGLDYYKSTTPRDIQETALRAQIEAGLPSGLPFIFHVRDSWKDFWRIFDDYKGLRGVVHSFSSGSKQLEAALGRGLSVGLNGIMTFTKDEAQLEAARRVPLDRLLLETDAPFLTPEPFRDELCEPKHAVTVAEFLSQLRGEPLGRLADISTQNAINLFNLA